MSALWRGAVEPAARPRLLPMTVAHLDAVLAIEAAAYAFPWSRGNFVDSLASAYLGRVLQGAGGEMLGYFIAMDGVDEMHLLNITVAPPVQGRGHARVLVDALVAQCRLRQARKLWLEVRAGNARARGMYLHLGFEQVGVRKGYYPAASGRREDAIVMSRAIAASPPGAPDALG
jgi:ribosomal-protein-alanine N-acetyltransferase